MVMGTKHEKKIHQWTAKVKSTQEQMIPIDPNTHGPQRTTITKERTSIDIEA